MALNNSMLRSVSIGTAEDADEQRKRQREVEDAQRMEEEEIVRRRGLTTEMREAEDAAAEAQEVDPDTVSISDIIKSSKRAFANVKANLDAWAVGDRDEYFAAKQQRMVEEKGTPSLSAAPAEKPAPQYFKKEQAWDRNGNIVELIRPTAEYFEGREGVDITSDFKKIGSALKAVLPKGAREAIDEVRAVGVRQAVLWNGSQSVSDTTPKAIVDEEKAEEIARDPAAEAPVTVTTDPVEVPPAEAPITEQALPEQQQEVQPAEQPATAEQKPEEIKAPAEYEIAYDEILSPVVTERELPPALRGFYLKAVGDAATGKTISAEKMIQVGAALNGGKARYMAYKDSNGKVAMKIFDGNEYIDASALPRSIDKYATEMNELKPGAGVAFGDKLSELLTPISGPAHPADDDNEIIKASRKALVDSGVLTAEEVADMLNPEKVDIQTGSAAEIDSYGSEKFKKYIIAGAQLRVAGQTKLNVISSTIAAVAASDEFKRAPTKRKSQILSETIRSTRAAISAADEQTIMETSILRAKKEEVIGKRISEEAADEMHYEPLSPTEAEKNRKDIAEVNEELRRIRPMQAQAKKSLGSQAKIIADKLSGIINPKAILEEARDPSKDSMEIIMGQIERLSGEDQAKAYDLYAEWRQAKDVYVRASTSTGQLEEKLSELEVRGLKGRPVNISLLEDGIYQLAASNAFLATEADRERFYSAVSDNASKGVSPEKAMMTAAMFSIFNKLAPEFRDSQSVLRETMMKYQKAADNGTIGNLPYGREIQEAVREQYKRFEITNFQKGFEIAMQDAPGWSASLMRESPSVSITVIDKGREVNKVLNFTKKTRQLKTDLRNLEDYVVRKYGKYGDEVLAKYMEPVIKLADKYEKEEIADRMMTAYIQPAEASRIRRIASAGSQPQSAAEGPANRMEALKNQISQLE